MGKKKRFLVFTGQSSFQGFLGGAGLRPSTASQKMVAQPPNSRFPWEFVQPLLGLCQILERETQSKARHVAAFHLGELLVFGEYLLLHGFKAAPKRKPHLSSGGVQLAPGPLIRAPHHSEHPQPPGPAGWGAAHPFRPGRGGAVHRGPKERVYAELIY